MSRGKKKRPALTSSEGGGEGPGVEEELSGAEAEAPRGRFSIPKPEGTAGTLLETVVIVAVALGLALGIQALLVKPYNIPSGSMEPTLDIGQRILVNRFIYDFKDPKPGDIVVFHPPAGAERASTEQCGVRKGPEEPCPTPTAKEASETFIKRIVAGPGDTLSVKNGHPVVNGVEKTDEPYINPCPSCTLTKTITIPPGHYFLMGDNRGQSDDSRFWGPIPEDWIVGEAFFTYWPPDRWGFL